MICPEIQSNPYSIYSFLRVAGYLRVSAIYPQHDGNFMCDVGIPNKEITYVYEKEVLNKTNQNSIAISVSQAVFAGDADKPQTLLDKFMLESISSFDSNPYAAMSEEMMSEKLEKSRVSASKGNYRSADAE